MATKGNPVISVRTTSDDQRLIKQLRKKLGVDTTQIFRLALRALATKEEVNQ
jgi:hypothetical protein